MDSTLSFQPSVSETLRDLELEVHQNKSQTARTIEKLTNKIRGLEEVLNILIASNNLLFDSSRLQSDVTTRLVLKNKSATDAAKALTVVRNLLADNLNLDSDVTYTLKSAELSGDNEIVFDAGDILNKIRILARLKALGSNNGNLDIENY